MPNPRINAASAKANAAKRKAEALKKVKANKVKSKKGAPKPSPTLKKGEAKPAASVKNTKVYKKIKSTSTYKPKLEKQIDISDLKLQKESPAKMSGRSYDMEKAYDKNLPMSERFHYLENERHDAPGKMKGSPYHMSNELKYGGPVIDQMQTLSQISANKVLRHMKK